MKRIIAASLVTAGAVAALAGCTVSSDAATVYNVDDCTDLTSALGTHADGLTLDPASKIADSKGSCEWTSGDDRSITVDITPAGDGIHVTKDTLLATIQKDKSLTVIDNPRLTGGDAVLFTPTASEKESSRTFTGQDLNGKVSVSFVGVPVTDKQASAIFSDLYKPSEA